MAAGSGKRPIVVVPTAGKSREQMKADARAALAAYLNRPRDTDADRPASTVE